jgi:ferredoxin-NADP reductase
MAAQRVVAYSQAHTTLLVAARHLDEVLLWPTLQRWEAFTPRFRSRLALSRDTCAPRAQDHVGRIDGADVAWALQQLGDVATESAQVFICGRNDFVESIVHMVTGLNVPEVSIRTERFGS